MKYILRNTGKVREQIMKQNREKKQTSVIDREEERAVSKKGRHLPVNIHIILLAAIVLVIGFSAFRLYQWDKGGYK